MAYKPEFPYLGEQIIINSGRVILNSKDDSVFLFGKKAIGFSSAGTINFDADTQGVLYYTSDATADWTLNVRGSSSTTINSKLATGDSTTVAFLVTNGATAYKHSALTIDGSAQTVKWSGGTPPAAGSASAIDAYSFTIIKTASATYTVLGAGPIKYA